MTTLSIRLSHWTVVPDATPAPTRPPIDRVGRRRREAESPGDEVPHDRSDQRGEYDHETMGAGRRLDDALADRDRHPGRHHGADDIEARRHRERSHRGERPGSDRHRHGVRGIVESVREVETQRNHDEDDQAEGAHQWRRPSQRLAGRSTLLRRPDRAVHPRATEPTEQSLGPVFARPVVSGGCAHPRRTA